MCSNIINVINDLCTPESMCISIHSIVLARLFPHSIYTEAICVYVSMRNVNMSDNCVTEVKHHSKSGKKSAKYMKGTAVYEYICLTIAKQ